MNKTLREQREDLRYAMAGIRDQATSENPELSARYAKMQAEMARLNREIRRMDDLNKPACLRRDSSWHRGR